MTKPQREFFAAIVADDAGVGENRVMVNTYGKTRLRLVHAVPPEHPIPRALIRKGFIESTNFRQDPTGSESYLYCYHATEAGEAAFGRSKDLSDRALLVLELIRATSDRGLSWLPGDKGQDRDFVGEVPLNVEGARDASILRSLKDSGLVVKTHDCLNEYHFLQVTPDGRKLLTSEEGRLERLISGRVAEAERRRKSYDEEQSRRESE